MKLLHEEYHTFDQLLDELPTGMAIEHAAEYFEDRDEDAFGVGASSEQDTDSTFNLVSRYLARKGA